jgi:tetratricopeptide (TPR) repeat protein
MDTNNLDQYSDDQLWALLAEAENEARVDILFEFVERNAGRGDNAQAASFAEQAATEAEKCMGSSTVENARYRQGLAFWRANRYEEAMSAFQAGIEKYQEPDMKIELSKNQWGVASCLYYMEQYEDSAKWAKISTDSALAEEAYSMAGLNKFLEAKSLYLNDQEQEALKACEEARSYRRREKELDEVADIDAYMATIYSYLGNHAEAVSLLRNCLVLAEATSSKSIKYFSYRLGNALIDLEEYQEARTHLEVARDLYKEVEDHASLADCFFSLSLTYRGDSDLNAALEVQTALELVRSATSLWDALGNDNSYIKGLQKISILLFTQENYHQSIEINKRIMDFCEGSDKPSHIDSYGWALLRAADCYQALGQNQVSLEMLEASPLFGKNSTHSGNVWFYSLKGKALFALDRHEESLGVAETALAGVRNDEVNYHIAHLYEIKARVSMEQDRPDKERHLAHSIALLLAFGETDKARELSEYFKPDFSPQKPDNILVEENAESAKDEHARTAELPGFGFTPDK